MNNIKIKLSPDDKTITMLQPDGSTRYMSPRELDNALGTTVIVDAINREASIDEIYELIDKQVQEYVSKQLYNNNVDDVIESNKKRHEGIQNTVKNGNRSLYVFDTFNIFGHSLSFAVSYEYVPFVRFTLFWFLLSFIYLIKAYIINTNDTNLELLIANMLYFGTILIFVKSVMILFIVLYESLKVD